MDAITFENAYYIKLGRSGEWERSSIEENKLRIGWPGQTIGDINSGNCDEIRKQIESEIPNSLPVHAISTLCG